MAAALALDARRCGVCRDAAGTSSNDELSSSTAGSLRSALNQIEQRVDLQ